MSIGGGKGEVMFDNRADGQGVMEYWTLTCAHCNSVRYVNPATGNIVRLTVITKMPEKEIVEVTYRETDPPIVCRKCMAYLCDNPVCATDCLPVKAGVDLILAKGQQDVQPFAIDDLNRFMLKEAYGNARIYPALGVELTGKD